MSKWDNQSIRDAERESIRDFVRRMASEFMVGGRVLDVGAGREPYRELVERYGASYEAYDSREFPGTTVADVDRHWVSPADGAYDVILCTQVLQYVRYPAMFLDQLKRWLVPGGMLVLTYPTCWDEVEAEDLFRYTKAGMQQLLASRGWDVVVSERRAYVELGGFKFWLGGGIVAQAKVQS